MRSIEAINADIIIVKEAIREETYLHNYEEVRELYKDLDELQEELYDAQTATI